MPLVFHNHRGYDGHLIMSTLRISEAVNEKIFCIPNNMEIYMNFVGLPQFIDSL